MKADSTCPTIADYVKVCDERDRLHKENERLRELLREARKELNPCACECLPFECDTCAFLAKLKEEGI